LGLHRRYCDALPAALRAAHVGAIIRKEQSCRLR